MPALYQGGAPDFVQMRRSCSDVFHVSRVRTTVGGVSWVVVVVKLLIRIAIC